MKQVVVIGAGKIGGAIASMLAQTGDFAVLVTPDELGGWLSAGGSQFGCILGPLVEQAQLSRSASLRTAICTTSQVVENGGA
jgi:glycine/D-amino acid oxidase-like deaminating enzyme